MARHEDASPRSAGVAPEPANGPARRSEFFERLAGPVLAYADKLAVVQGEDVAALLRHGKVLLERFASDAGRAGALGFAIAPARVALALILDAKARENKSIDVQSWASGAHLFLFDGRDVTVASLRDFIRIAAESGPDFDELRAFLEHCIDRLRGERQKFDRSRGSNWSGIFLVLLVGFALSVLAWAGLVEWRSNRDLAAVFNAEALEIGLDRSGAFPDLASRLGNLKAAVARVRQQSEKSPVHLFAGLLGYDATTNAEASYRAAVNAHLPAVIAAAVDETIASEGEPITLYDAIRAWSILTKADPWSQAYLAGWLRDRALSRPELSGLAEHADALVAPDGPLPQPDAELFAQALGFAQDAPEADRAFLELRRSDGAEALPPWLAETAVPGLGAVFVRKSGLDVNQPMPGLYTAAGWTYARDFGAGLAVQEARRAASRLFATAPPQQNAAADLVLDSLQRSTLRAWSGFLDDLRVRPFADADTAILVSGLLAERKSPIELLLRAVWNEAGGNDRKRSQAQQLAVAATFGAAIQYVEQGKLSEVSALFAGLNVALGAMDRSQAAGLHRLMSVMDREQSIVTLQQAPPVVMQIVEDVLAQTGQSQSDPLTSPLTRAWQNEALASCKAATEAAFPFADTPRDADFTAVSQAFAPGGDLDRFFKAKVEPNLDRSVSPWRWKPEARFSGLSENTAAFFQRAQAITDGLFVSRATGGDVMTLAALAERGQAYISVNGKGGPVEATSDALSVLWPGSDPAQGVEVTFKTPDGDTKLTDPGIWGLYHLVHGLRLRERDNGLRYLVDLQSGPARLFLEIAFPGEVNLLSVRESLEGFQCPSVL